MSRRREPSAGDIRRARREVRELREQGVGARIKSDPGLAKRGPWRTDGEPEAPLGGWKPIFDDAGHVIPDPDPETPTDVPPDYLEGKG